MRRDLALAALLLPLGGCYVPSSGPPAYAQAGYPPGGGYENPQPGYPPPGYQPPAYPQPGYQQPGYPPPGYPQPAADPYGNTYPGYSYNNGSPTLLVEGAAVPLILFGGAWGYYDHDRHWHHAPDEISRHLEQQHAAGGFRPGGPGYGQPRPEGRPPPGADPYRGQGSVRPPEQGRPAPSAFRPAEQPHPTPGADAFRGQTFFHPNEQARPAAAPAPHEEHPRSHDCPPGQRC